MESKKLGSDNSIAIYILVIEREFTLTINFFLQN